MENDLMGSDSQTFKETCDGHQETDDIELSDRIIIEPTIKQVTLFNEKTCIPDANQNEPEISKEDAKPGYNIRPLLKHATTYELEKFKKNVLLIFNQENIEGYKQRLGTEKDVKALQTTFENLGFSVTEYKDLIRDDIFNELNKFSDTNFSDYGCLAIAVLTHGFRGKLMAKTGSYHSEDILNVFNVHDKPTLVTKPRILLVQACRKWENIHESPEKPAAKVRKYSEEGDEHYYLPEESDLLILESSYMGKVAFRDEIEGSWFIQSLCNKVKALADTLDLESIAIEMKREVAIEKAHTLYNRAYGTLKIQKQMPVVTSTLIRKLYLKKYEASSSIEPAEKPSARSSEMLGSSVAAEPLHVQFGICNCNFDHNNHIRNCLRLMEWMSATETVLQSAECSEEDTLTLDTELKEHELILESIKLLGPQLCQPTTAEGEIGHVEDIMTGYDKRFASITERVKELKKNVQN